MLYLSPVTSSAQADSTLSLIHIFPSADENLRLEIEEKAQKLGWPALHQELQKIDPISAEDVYKRQMHA